MNGFPATLLLAVGLDVNVNGRKSRIVEISDLKTVQVMDHVTGEIRSVTVDEVKPDVGSPNKAAVLDALSEKDIKLAQDRFRMVEPLVDAPYRGRIAVEARAEEVGVHPSTLYKWLRLYESTRLLSSLAPKGRNDKGVSRLTPEVEAVVREVIESEYLTPQRKSPTDIAEAVLNRCNAAGIKPPHPSTVRRRLKDVSLFRKMSARRSKKEADAMLSPIRGRFPGAEWPLAVVQIDHTPLDIILVDDVNRESIGRPYLTLAVDVFSRMVAGFYVSLDPPGALSTGLCLAHAILPKEKWLMERDIEGEWPLWGLPTCVHADNAREFRGSMLERACAQYRINTEWRPVGKARYGGHVERLLGTLSREIHTLPGTTFSNTRQRGRYDSEGNAVFTLGEIEAWLGTHIVQVYHRKVHSALKMPPIEKYRQGILGDKNRPGIGLPQRIQDEARLRLEFMPFMERTVQRYGIAIDGLCYWHDVLRPWINAEDSRNRGAKRKFIVRRDPRDISKIWFFDPELNSYFEVPYRDSAHPPISVWELRSLQRRLAEQGRRRVDEQELFEAYDRLRELEELADKETKAARRTGQRRRLGIGATSKAVGSDRQPGESQDIDVSLDDIQPFDEMEEMS